MRNGGTGRAPRAAERCTCMCDMPAGTPRRHDEDPAAMHTPPSSSGVSCRGIQAEISRCEPRPIHTLSQLSHSKAQRQTTAR